MKKIVQKKIVLPKRGKEWASGKIYYFFPQCKAQTLESILKDMAVLWKDFIHFILYMYCTPYSQLEVLLLGTVLRVIKYLTKLRFTREDWVFVYLNILWRRKPAECCNSLNFPPFWLISLKFFISVSSFYTNILSCIYILNCN